ncbi:hypothetical protein MB02_14250 [Croceicoccus estronivorus]|uniref:hypothetical protein n=1 Tax=Croceicoccus estronivorus TaxID=1172626 RepID=UPI00083746DE|nr:hypothetical protein [Croceicoccus estronivorus]OCC22924.1 hypothetical protein MB02_14250 [Croceicoccus estronivorus]
MTRITPADQVMLLLRQQLQRMTKGAGQARGSRAGASQLTGGQNPLHRVSALATLDGLSDEERGKALIRALLTEEFGEELANEAKFERIVGEVHRIIASDDGSRDLLKRSLREVSRRPAD